MQLTGSADHWCCPGSQNAREGTGMRCNATLLLRILVEELPDHLHLLGTEHITGWGLCCTCPAGACPWRPLKEGIPALRIKTLLTELCSLCPAFLLQNTLQTTTVVSPSLAPYTRVCY